MGYLATKPGTVRVVFEECLNTVINVIRLSEIAIFVKGVTMSHAVEGFGEVQCIDNDVRIGL
jgi:DNA-directed RNA polymerase alpha subunit